MLKTFHLIFSFLLLIYTNQVFSQSLNIEVVGENESKTVVIDSVGYKTQFDNYTTLETELYALEKKLTRLGYIDTTIESIFKQNDTLFKAELFLGKKVNRIRIAYDSDFNAELLNFIYHTKGTNCLKFSLFHSFGVGFT